jgi:GrpB-like predicted nucleotidyltransferase (UPF0157 family)
MAGRDPDSESDRDFGPPPGPALDPKRGAEPWTDLGLARGTVVLRDHRESWHVAFEREAARLRDLLGDRALAVKHVGSTAVRGLPAKPVVDLSVAVDSLAVARDCVPALRRAGYERRPDTVPDRLFLARGPRDARTHYLTLTPLDSGTWRDHLDLRAYLRGRPDARERYGRVKRELAARHANDRAAYTAAKGGFVERLLAEARGAAR